MKSHNQWALVGQNGKDKRSVYDKQMTDGERWRPMASDGERWQLMATNGHLNLHKFMRETKMCGVQWYLSCRPTILTHLRVYRLSYRPFYCHTGGWYENKDGRYGEMASVKLATMINAKLVRYFLMWIFMWFKPRICLSLLLNLYVPHTN